VGPTNARVNTKNKPPRLLEGDTAHVEITATDDDGLGLATHKGLTLHIAGGFSGEHVLVKVTHVSKQRAEAHAVVVNIVRPHLQRRRAPCSHHESRARVGCTGCPLMLLKPAAQQALKQEQLAKLGITPDRWVEVTGAELGYRWSAKRVAQGSAGRLMLGSYLRRSHRIADMITCVVDHPLIQSCALELQRLANDLRIAGYDESTCMGELRYVWLKTNGKQVLVTLITSREVTEELRTLASQLVDACRARGFDVGVHVGVQNDTGNNMRTESATLLHGAKTLSVELAGVSLELGPLGFLQPNPAVAALAYADLCHSAAGQPVTGTLALDVYAGAGATTHQLRTQFRQVLANDADHESARSLGVKPQDARDFLDDMIKQGAKPSLAVCNPPRGGMGKDVCESLIKLAPERIHIMSCNPVSLARDLKQLGAHYSIEGTRAYDTLPQTLHVEVVTMLTRNEGA